MTMLVSSAVGAVEMRVIQIVKTEELAGIGISRGARKMGFRPMNDHDRLVSQETVLDSIQSAPFEDVAEVRDRMRRW